jgi:hypothetical protein
MELMRHVREIQEFIQCFGNKPPKEIDYLEDLGVDGSIIQ